MFGPFGEHDPRAMPPRFFRGHRALDSKTAVRADVAKQDFAVAPRHWYVDATFRCDRCGEELSLVRATPFW